jgi:K+-transporting ATPase ATPase A chain
VCRRRALARRQRSEVADFRVGLARTVVRNLLRLSVVSVIVLPALAVIANIIGTQDVRRSYAVARRFSVAPSRPGSRSRRCPRRRCFNASSAHPFEIPARLSNVVEIVAMSLLPAAFIRTLGVMVGDEREGAALFAAVPIPFVIGAVAIIWAQTAGHAS